MFPCAPPFVHHLIVGDAATGSGASKSSVDFESHSKAGFMEA